MLAVYTIIYDCFMSNGGRWPLNLNLDTMLD